MQALASGLVSSVIQLALLAGVPLAAYLLYRRRRYREQLRQSLRRAGLQVGEPRYLWLAAGLALAGGIAILAYFALVQPPLTHLTREGTALHAFFGLGLGGSALVLAVLYGVVKTGLAEEILFRGLVAGALARRMSLLRANVLQAMIFLTPHLLLLVVAPALWPILPLVFAIALLLGWLRIRSGSILGPWLIHAACNLSMALAIAAQTATCPVSGCDAGPLREYPVGRTHLDFLDPDRLAWDGRSPRPLAVTVWYPAAADSVQGRWQGGPFVFGWGARDAQLRASDPRPLVVLSHGTGGSAAQLSWLAETLVGEGGFIVAAVNHHSNTAAEANQFPEAFVLPGERSRDLTTLIDLLLDHPHFGSLIDPDRIGAAGFSLGGYSALALAGVNLSFQEWRGRCRGYESRTDCTLPPEARFSMAQIEHRIEVSPVAKDAVARSATTARDSRVGAVFLMAPALLSLVDGDSLARVTAPVEIILGGADRNIEVAATVENLGEHLPSAQVEVVPGLGHYAFMARCTPRGQLFLRSLCVDPGAHRRNQLHQDTGGRALAFFRANLGRRNRWEDG